MIPTARVLSIPHYMFKGGLVDPRVRASNEHILIVRVPRAGGRPGYPSHPSEAARCASTGNVPATPPPFFSILLDGVVGEAQIEETAEPPFLRTEETRKPQADSFSSAGAHKGAVDHDGIIVLGRMKFQHHLAA
jgi:hypothetical protein